MFAMPYSEELARRSVEDGLSTKTETEADPDDREGETPTPAADRQGYGSEREAGPVRRFNDVFTDLGSVQLEAMGLDGSEVANATSTLRDEMYRSRFPIVQARYSVKCEDDECGTEYDREMEFCLECARAEMIEDGIRSPPTDPEEIPDGYRDHPVRPPDPSQKREAERKAESVNKEGQSLRDVMKMAEDDQSRLGISTLVIKRDYAVAAGDTSVFGAGDVIYDEPDEVVRGDPKRVVPVVDENGRVGNWKYTCPVHREDALTTHQNYEDGHTRCEHCGADLREVYFVELEGTSARQSAGVDKYFFDNEVVTWARYYPRLHGLDGLSPVHHVWLKQAILHWMDIYGAAYYDPESDRYPNKFMVVHTTNPQAWEKQFEKAEEETRENPYNEQILMNEYSGESNSTPEVQVIDLMNDELLGQDQQLKDQFKQDIRANWGVTNIFDSELGDAGGLNNEGLQMEVTDRSIASAMHDTVSGPLDELSKHLGIDDYIYEFVPPVDDDVEELEQHIRVGEKAADAGLDASFEDNTVEVADGDFEAGEDDGGGLADLFGDFGGLEDVVTQKAEDQSVRVFRLDAPDGGDYAEDLLAMGVEMPHGDVYVDWNLEAWGDDALREPHISVYGCMEDMESVADGSARDVATVGPGDDPAAALKAARERAASDKYPDPEDARDRAEELGLTGVHASGDPDSDGTLWMPGGSHAEYERAVDAKADESGDARASDTDETRGTDRTPAEARAKEEPKRNRRSEDGGTGN
jgi:hypothetical protein